MGNPDAIGRPPFFVFTFVGASCKPLFQLFYLLYSHAEAMGHSIPKLKWTSGALTGRRETFLDLNCCCAIRDPVCNPGDDGKYDILLCSSKCTRFTMPIVPRRLLTDPCPSRFTVDEMNLAAACGQPTQNYATVRVLILIYGY